MSYMPVHECIGCGQTKECHSAEYGKAVGAKSAVLISEQTNYIAWDKRITCNMCDDCAGKTPRGIYNWIWWCLGISFLLVVFGIYDMSTSTSPDMPLGFLAIILGWIVGIVGAASGLLKIWGAKGSLIFALVLGWTPIPALVLLINLKKVKRAYWVNKQMKEKANQIFNDTEKKNDVLMAGIAAKAADELTAEEKKLLEEKQKNDRRIEQEKKGIQEQANKSRYRGAIIGIVLTVLIAIYGFSTYNSGGYMVWFGIELSIGGFWALLGAFLVYDIVAIVIARKKIRESEVLTQQETKSDFWK